MQTVGVRKHRSERGIGVITFVLAAIGLIIIYAIGPMRANSINAAYGTDYGADYFFMHQLFAVLVAAVAFVAAFKFPYLQLRKFAKIILLVGLGLCVVLAISAWLSLPLASCSRGACRWINLGPVGTIQPAEFLKIGLVLYLAQLLASRKRAGQLEDWREFWLPYGVVCVLSLLFVVVFQKDLGSGLSLVAIMLAILWAGGVKLKYFGIALGVLIVGGLAVTVTSPHRVERVLTFLGGGNSEMDYQIENALIAIGSGGFLGVGIGNSVQATGYLPESINDSVFAILGETFGFIGLTLIVGCFGYLLFKLLKVAAHLPTEPALVVTGIWAWVAAHVIINIMAMTGLIPLTGITLPLMSYGGSSLVLIAASLGLTLQLSCYTSREEVNTNEDSSSRRGIRGTHYASRRGGAGDSRRASARPHRVLDR